MILIVTLGVIGLIGTTATGRALADKLEFVQITNDGAHPVPVAVTAVKTPYQQTTFLGEFQCEELGGSSGQFVCRADFETVPAGKLLVVTHFSGNVPLGIGGAMRTSTLVVDGARLTVTGALPNGSDYYNFGGQVTGYVRGGVAPQVILSMVTSVPHFTKTASIAGYLIDCPGGSCSIP